MWASNNGLIAPSPENSLVSVRNVLRICYLAAELEDIIIRMVRSSFLVQRTRRA